MEFFGFFCVIVFMVLGWGAYYTYCEYRNKAQERELQHAERMKAIETGHPLPDAEVAWAAAERSRARMLGLVGVLVPTLTGLAMVIATGILVGLGLKEESNQMPMPFGGVVIPWYGKALFVMWPAWGLVSLVAVVLSVVSLHRRGHSASVPAGRPPTRTVPGEPVLASFVEVPPKP